MIERVEALVMKTRVFADDGQPESWDCNDNYYDLDQAGAQVHVIRWERSAANGERNAPESQPPVHETANGNDEPAEGAVRIGA